MKVAMVLLRVGLPNQAMNADQEGPRLFKAQPSLAGYCRR
jgi:hypothetical protein